MAFKALILAASAALIGCSSTGVNLFKTDPLVHQRTLFAHGDYSIVAAELRNSVSRLPRRYRSEAYRILGQSYARIGNLSDAVQTYQMAVGLYPKDLQLLTQLAQLLHRVGLDDRAKPFFERVVDIHPNNAAANLGLAEIYRARGNLARSRSHYEKTLEEWAENPNIWREYSGVLSESRNFALARTAIQVALDLGGDKTDTLLAYARIERRHRLFEPAYRRIDEALALDPDWNEAVLQKALWFLEDARPKEAAILARRVLKSEKDDPLARWVQAQSALRRGRFSRARADLRVAAAGPHPFIAVTAQRMLDTLEKTQ